MQLAVALIFVLGISHSVKGEDKGVSDSIKSTVSPGSSTYYGYRYPYYLGPVNALSHGFRYPTYSRGGSGLGGYGSYGSRYPISSSASHVSQNARYPAGTYGWGGYNQHYPGNAMPKTSTMGLNSGGIYRGQGAQVYQSPVQYTGYTIGKPIVSSYGVFYPRVFPATQTPNHGVSGVGGFGRIVTSYPTGSSVNTVSSRGNNHQSIYGGLGLGYRVGQSVPPMTHHVVDHRGLGPYGGYGIQYQGGATATTLPRGIYQPIILRFGNTSSGYNFYYPTAASANHATQRLSYPAGWGIRNTQVHRPLGSGAGNIYKGYNSYYPAATSVSQTTQNTPHPMSWELRHVPVYIPVRMNTGNPYSGYGSHYPTGSSVSPTTVGNHNAAGWAPGNLNGGYSGYGQGYGVQYPSGTSNTPVSYGLGRPIGYSIYILGYGKPYPVGQPISTVSHGIHNPYGKWGLSVPSGGYGTYHPTGHTISNLAYGNQSPQAYGGYGYRLPVNTQYQFRNTHQGSSYTS